MPRLIMTLAPSVFLAGSFAWSQDYPTATVPPDLGVLEHTSTGVMYVDKDLLEQSQKLETQIGQLRGRIFQGGSLTKATREKLAAMETRLAALRSEIDEKKVHAQPFRVSSRRETQSFEVGEAEQIVITADDVNVRGWNGKNIKCVVEKFVLSEQEPDESEFDAIVVQHEIRLADDLVGMSDAARAAAEQKFLVSEDGSGLDAKARERRAAFVAEIHDSYWMYRPLQGNEVNVLQIAGLSGQEGNRHLTGRTKSPGGGGTLGGYWRRSAKMTIYVPKCRHVAIRGCKKSVDIKSVQANVILTTHGSQDISYGSDFAIRDIEGGLVIDQAPIRIIESVRGDVDMRQTDEYTNTGTMHRGGLRTSSSPPPDPTTIRAVAGNCRGRFVRADLTLSDVAGSLDVINEYGNTRLVIDQPLSSSTHRVLSHSGVIRAVSPKADSAGIPVFAYTQTGTAQVAFPRDEFEDKSFGGNRRSWYGFQSAGAKFGFTGMQRPRHAWDNAERSTGIDLVSNAGSVIVGPDNEQD